jgi:hypothetical protein
MTANLEEMKKISRMALVKELVEKTKNCGLIWHQLSATQHHVKYLDYDFYAARTSQKVYTLDVLKDGKFYRSYNSIFQEEVENLFIEIELSYGDSNIDKYKKIGNFLGRLNGCGNITKNTYNISVVGFGVFISGTSTVEQLRPINPSIELEPLALTFGPSQYAWVGELADITTNDNTTYITQKISGEFPTNWGYAFLEFNTTPVLNLLPPYATRIQISHRRELNGGVFLNIDLLINGAIVFSKTDDESFESSTSFVLEDTGLQMTADGPTYIDSIILRMYMFTNTGNLDTRTIQIDYASVTMQGFELVS